MRETVRIFKSKNLQNLDTQTSPGESIASSEQFLTGQETWSWGIWKRLKILLFSFPQSLLSESAFSLTELRAWWQSLKETNITDGKGRLSQRLRKQMLQSKHGDMCESLGCDGIDPRVRRELAGVIEYGKAILYHM